MQVSGLSVYRPYDQVWGPGGLDEGLDLKGVVRLDSFNGKYTTVFTQA